MEGVLSDANETINKRDAIGFWDTDSITLQTTTESEFIIIEVPINH